MLNLVERVKTEVKTFLEWNWILAVTVAHLCSCITTIEHYQMNNNISSNSIIWENFAFVQRQQNAHLLHLHTCIIADVRMWLWGDI